MSSIYSIQWKCNRHLTCSQIIQNIGGVSRDASIHITWKYVKNFVKKQAKCRCLPESQNCVCWFWNEYAKGWSKNQNLNILILHLRKSCLFTPYYMCGEWNETVRYNSDWAILPFSLIHLDFLLLHLQYAAIPGRTLTRWGWNKLSAIFQTTFSNVFYWMTIYESQLRFHWNLFLMVQLTIFQHWFR